VDSADAAAHATGPCRTGDAADAVVAQVRNVQHSTVGGGHHVMWSVELRPAVSPPPAIAITWLFRWASLLYAQVDMSLTSLIHATVPSSPCREPWLPPVGQSGTREHTAHGGAHTTHDS